MGFERGKLQCFLTLFIKVNGKCGSHRLQNKGAGLIFHRMSATEIVKNGNENKSLDLRSLSAIIIFLYMLYCPLVSLQKHVENTQATTVATPRRSNTLRILEDVSYEMTTRV